MDHKFSIRETDAAVPTLKKESAGWERSDWTEWWHIEDACCRRSLIRQDWSGFEILEWLAAIINIKKQTPPASKLPQARNSNGSRDVASARRYGVLINRSIPPGHSVFVLIPYWLCVLVIFLISTRYLLFSARSSVPFPFAPAFFPSSLAGSVSLWSFNLIDRKSVV